MSRGWGQTHFSGVQQQDKGQRAQIEAQGVQSEHEEDLLHFEGDRRLKLAAQRDCGLLLWTYSKPVRMRSCAACSR